jgi:hypothetical protein
VMTVVLCVLRVGGVVVKGWSLYAVGSGCHISLLLRRAEGRRESINFDALSLLSVCHVN